MCLGVVTAVYFPDIIQDINSTSEKCFKVEIKTPLELRDKCRELKDSVNEELDSESTSSREDDAGDMNTLYKDSKKREYQQIKALCDYKTSVATITDYNSKCTKELIIPRKVNGSYVVGIDDFAFKDKGITSVKFPERVVVIGQSAFR